jgi:chorismate mutase/prephenate dehydratase
MAVRSVKDWGNPEVAAIGSPEAAVASNLSILRAHVSNRTDNQTRYIVVAQQQRRVDSRIPAKTSMVLATAQEPGALAHVLAVFKGHGINLTKLQSRPVPGNPWEEMFYLDFEGNLESAEVKQALQDLTKFTRYTKILGCYPDYNVPTVRAAHPAQVEPAPVAEAAAAKSTGGGGKSKKAAMLGSREHKAEDTIIDVRGVKIGGNSFVVMAGPCSVETPEQIMDCARHAKEQGALILRGGCFKPRSSPYSFQGLGMPGVELLLKAGRQYGLPIITEIMANEDVEAVSELTDIIQIGARNMQNFSLLKHIGRTRKPVMLKRGLSSSIDDLLLAVEYILSEGNQQVMLCERGIRTFETATRNTLDISAVPVLRQRTHLPIIIDPSHAAGERDLVSPLCYAAKAVGAHGIIVEFHPEPEKALSDGPQALRFPQFSEMMRRLNAIPRQD